MISSQGDASGDGGVGDLAVVGQGTPHESKVSIQVLQNIYYELTGKSEDVSKAYSDPFQIEFSDLEQLNYRVTQCCEQYNVRASSCSATIFYVKDSKETFSSFDRFRAFNAGNSSSVESVLIAYDFMILLPKVGTIQNYNLSVRLSSRIAVEGQMAKGMLIDVPRMFRTFGARTAIVSVKYVDYIVARNLLDTVDSWLDSVPKESASRLWKSVVRKSHYIPLISRYFVGIVAALIAIEYSGLFVKSDATIRDGASFVVASLVGIFAFYRLAFHIGRAAESSLDRWSELSYLSLTAGDKAAIRSARAENSKSVLVAILKFVGAMSSSILAKFAAALLFYLAS
ncbi:hypothetical protein [Tahibacter aquaticus]|uniref:hypothetical protein n=1 Tax=Tahibacter aquaticus TaxID=520092 RepID=UPI00105DEE90|nr:hypothetical protein [Tahibacter aquaticus]